MRRSSRSSIRQSTGSTLPSAVDGGEDWTSSEEEISPTQSMKREAIRKYGGKAPNLKDQKEKEKTKSESDDESLSESVIRKEYLRKYVAKIAPPPPVILQVNSDESSELMETESFVQKHFKRVVAKAPAPPPPPPPPREKRNRRTDNSDVGSTSSVRTRSEKSALHLPAQQSPVPNTGTICTSTPILNKSGSPKKANFDISTVLSPVAKPTGGRVSRRLRRSRSKQISDRVFDRIDTPDADPSSDELNPSPFVHNKRRRGNSQARSSQTQSARPPAEIYGKIISHHNTLSQSSRVSTYAPSSQSSARSSASSVRAEELQLSRPGSLSVGSGGDENIGATQTQPISLILESEEDKEVSSAAVEPEQKISGVDNTLNQTSGRPSRSNDRRTSSSSVRTKDGLLSRPMSLSAESDKDVTIGTSQVHLVTSRLASEEDKVSPVPVESKQQKSGRNNTLNQASGRPSRSSVTRTSSSSVRTEEIQLSQPASLSAGSESSKNIGATQTQPVSSILESGEDEVVSPARVDPEQMKTSRRSTLNQTSGRPSRSSVTRTSSSSVRTEEIQFSPPASFSTGSESDENIGATITQHVSLILESGEDEVVSPAPIEPEQRKSSGRNTLNQTSGRPSGSNVSRTSSSSVRTKGQLSLPVPLSAVTDKDLTSGLSHVQPTTSDLESEEDEKVVSPVPVHSKQTNRSRDDNTLTQTLGRPSRSSVTRTSSLFVRTEEIQLSRPASLSAGSDSNENIGAKQTQTVSLILESGEHEVVSPAPVDSEQKKISGRSTLSQTAGRSSRSNVSRTSSSSVSTKVQLSRQVSLSAVTDKDVTGSLSQVQPATSDLESEEDEKVVSPVPVDSEQNESSRRVTLNQTSGRPSRSNVSRTSSSSVSTKEQFSRPVPLSAVTAKDVTTGLLQVEPATSGLESEEDEKSVSLVPVDSQQKKSSGRSTLTQTSGRPSRSNVTRTSSSSVRTEEIQLSRPASLLSGSESVESGEDEVVSPAPVELEQKKSSGRSTLNQTSGRSIRSNVSRTSSSSVPVPTKEQFSRPVSLSAVTDKDVTGSLSQVQPAISGLESEEDEKLVSPVPVGSVQKKSSGRSTLNQTSGRSSRSNVSRTSSSSLRTKEQFSRTVSLSAVTDKDVTSGLSQVQPATSGLESEEDEKVVSPVLVDSEQKNSSTRSTLNQTSRRSIRSNVSRTSSSSVRTKEKFSRTASLSAVTDKDVTSGLSHVQPATSGLESEEDEELVSPVRVDSEQKKSSGRSTLTQTSGRPSRSNVARTSSSSVRTEEIQLSRPASLSSGSESGESGKDEVSPAPVELEQKNSSGRSTLNHTSGRPSRSNVTRTSSSSVRAKEQFSRPVSLSAVTDKDVTSGLSQVQPATSDLESEEDKEVVSPVPVDSEQKNSSGRSTLSQASGRPSRSNVTRTSSSSVRTEEIHLSRPASLSAGSKSGESGEDEVVASAPVEPEQKKSSGRSTLNQTSARPSRSNVTRTSSSSVRAKEQFSRSVSLSAVTDKDVTSGLLQVQPTTSGLESEEDEVVVSPVPVDSEQKKSPGPSTLDQTSGRLSRSNVTRTSSSVRTKRQLSRPVSLSAVTGKDVPSGLSQVHSATSGLESEEDEKVVSPVPLNQTSGRQLSRPTSLSVVSGDDKNTGAARAQPATTGSESEGDEEAVSSVSVPVEPARKKRKVATKKKDEDAIYRNDNLLSMKTLRNFLTVTNQDVNPRDLVHMHKVFNETMEKILTKLCKNASRGMGMFSFQELNAALQAEGLIGNEPHELMTEMMAMFTPDQYRKMMGYIVPLAGDEDTPPTKF